MLISWTVGTVGLLLTAAVAATDKDRDNRSGFRERVPCIETGKFYRHGRGWKLLLVTTTFELVFDFSEERFTRLSFHFQLFRHIRLQIIK
jgi:hypothetical protein